MTGTITDFSNTALISYPVQWPQGLPAPDVPDLHSTIAYVPDVTGVDPADMQAAVDAAFGNIFIFAKVTELDYFGPDKDIPVLRVAHKLLPINYNLITDVLTRREVPWSQLYDYNPHVTIDDFVAAVGPVPPKLVLKPPVLWWRGENIG